MKSLIILYNLLVLPLAFGLPASAAIGKDGRERGLVALPLGFFLQLALFHAICFPCIYFRVDFTAFVTLFNIVSTGLGVACLCLYWRSGPLKPRRVRLGALEAVYLAVLLVLLGFQLFNAIRYDTTYMSYDDTGYIAFAGDAIARNKMMVTDPSTGLACAINPQRAAQTSLMYPALLTCMSGISLAVINRTVLEVYDIILAYLVYAYIGCILFKRRENVFTFLVIIALLYIWGYYSHYSVTFRLLGPNYQGKAILAVSLFPLLYAICIRAINRPYQTKTGLILLALSMASVSLSLFGAFMIVLNTAIIILLSLARKKRQIGNLGYLPWACTVPLFHMALFYFI